MADVAMHDERSALLRVAKRLITERGRCEASEAGLLALYPEKA